ncbi:Hypothetical protein D9617_30g011500 [Elsinoe fawcettii]|nr:Hypothetical protein D9617_30g011500 [Elsinoe fawcettii]
MLLSLLIAWASLACWTAHAQVTLSSNTTLPANVSTLASGILGGRPGSPSILHVEPTRLFPNLTGVSSSGLSGRTTSSPDDRPTGTRIVSSTITRLSSSPLLTTPTVPFGVFVSTVSGKTFTLTYVQTTHSAGIATGTLGATIGASSRSTTNGIEWVVLSTPSFFPSDVVPTPPAGVPIPVQRKTPDSLSACLFGCGDGHDTSGGGGETTGGPIKLPCVINCGLNDDAGRQDRNPGGGGDDEATRTDTRSTEANKSTSCSCRPTTATSCDETIFITTSYSSDTTRSTVLASTSTKCQAFTACGILPTTVTTTTATKTSATEFICDPTACAGTCLVNRKRDVSGPQPNNAYKVGCSLIEAAAHKKVSKRALPAPSPGETIDHFISEIFGTNHVEGAEADGPPLALFGNWPSTPTSRFDAFGDAPFSAGVDGLLGCIATVLVSHRGVWTSHFWQTTFRKALTDSIDSKGHDERFQKDVLDPFSGRNTPPDFVPLTSLPAGAFAADQHPQLLIVSPGTGQKGGEARYPTVVDRLVDEVQRFVPDLVPGSIVKWTYKAVTDEEYNNVLS